MSSLSPVAQEFTPSPRQPLSLNSPKILQRNSPLLRVCSAAEFVPVGKDGSTPPKLLDQLRVEFSGSLDGEKLGGRVRRLQIKSLPAAVSYKPDEYADYWKKYISQTLSVAGELKARLEKFLTRFPGAFQGLKYHSEDELASLSKMILCFSSTKELEKVEQVCRKFELYFESCKLRDPNFLYFSLYQCVGDAYIQDTDYLPQALEYYEKARGIADTIQLSPLRLGDMYMSIARILWAMGYEEEVFTIVESPAFNDGYRVDRLCLWLETALSRKIDISEIRIRLLDYRVHLQDSILKGSFVEELDKWLERSCPYLLKQDLEIEDRIMQAVLQDPEKLPTNRVKAHLMLAKVWFIHGEYDRANVWVERLQDLLTDTNVSSWKSSTRYISQTQATHFRAALLVRRGHIAEARALLATVPQEDDPNIYFMIVKHRIFLELTFATSREEGLQNAIAICKEVREDCCPGNVRRPSYTLLLGLLLLAQNNVKAAQELYEDEDFYFSKNPQVKLMGAILSIVSGDIEEAKTRIEEGLLLGRQNGDLYCLGAAIYKSLGDEDGLQRLKRQFLFLQPSHGYLWLESFLVDPSCRQLSMPDIWNKIMESHAHTPIGGKPAWAPYFLYPVSCSLFSVSRVQFYENLILKDLGTFWGK